MSEETNSSRLLKVYLESLTDTVEQQDVALKAFLDAQQDDLSNGRIHRVTDLLIR